MEEKALVLEKCKILIEYGKSVSTLFLAVAGAQITLLGSLFKESFNQNKEIAISSVFAMFVASIIALTISESVVRRLALRNFKLNYLIL